MAYVSVGGSVMGQANPISTGSIQIPSAGTMPVPQGGAMQIPSAGSMPIPTPTEVKPNQMVQNQINPKAFGAPAAIEGMYGQANPGTFTRSVGNPNPAFGKPIAPPMDIQDTSSIAPTQNFENL